MKRLVPLCALALILCSLPALARAERTTTFTGEYVWQPGDSVGDLEAIFKPAGKPAGDQQWDVSFHFVFSGQSHTYQGTAIGSLEEGLLEGKVYTENRRRIFTFEGSFEDGVFEGTHAEIKREREWPMGTLTLQR